MWHDQTSKLMLATGFISKVSYLIASVENWSKLFCIYFFFLKHVVVYWQYKVATFTIFITVFKCNSERSIKIRVQYLDFQNCHKMKYCELIKWWWWWWWWWWCYFLYKSIPENCSSAMLNCQYLKTWLLIISGLND